MMHLLYEVIAILVGYGLTLVFYIGGEPLVSPSLFLARLFVPDHGGESLLPAFTVINTVLCSILIYGGLWATEHRRR
jgi:hypothetical protein